MTGVDLSPVMIDTARRLAGEQGVGIRFEVGDAASLPYEDASFDVVASALGVFAPDHAAAARELARVCRPGGRLGLAAWQPDPEAERMHAPSGRHASPAPAIAATGAARSTWRTARAGVRARL